MLDHFGKCWVKFDFNITFVRTLSNISLVFLMLGPLSEIRFEYTDGFIAIATVPSKIYLWLPPLQNDNFSKCLIFGTG